MSVIHKDANRKHNAKTIVVHGICDKLDQLFQYIDIDFITLPDSADGNKHVLDITCDFSFTTVLVSTKNTDAETVVKALLEHWQSIYPDPDLIHNDDFDNKVMEMLTKARELKHTSNMHTVCKIGAWGSREQKQADAQGVKASL